MPPTLPRPPPATLLVIVATTPAAILMTMPPPSPRTLLLLIVVLLIVSGPTLWMPPATTEPLAGIVWLPEIRLSEIVRLPRFSIAPLAPEKLLMIRTPLIVLVTLLCRYIAPPSLNE